MRNELETYEKLRKAGHTEEQALSETRDFLKIGYERDENSKYVTKQDLKIALFEFAKEYKLEWMNIKLNFFLFVLTAYLGVFGYMFKLLFEILSRLPK